MNGVLLVHKEEGLSSFAVLHKLKKILHIDKIGHAGTLDPLASGVLVVLLGEGTKLSNYLLEKDKEYIARILIGKSTTTQDILGDVVAEKEVQELKNVEETLDGFLGESKQLPPMYSAIKKDGKKLYELARKGQVIERDKRTIYVSDISLESDIVYQDGCAEFTFRTTVSKGTYIRTLCEDIGEKLGYPACMKSLVRSKSGIFSLKNAYTLAQIEQGMYKLLEMNECLVDITEQKMDEALYDKVKYGQKLPHSAIACGVDIVKLSYNNRLIAIYKKHETEYKVERVWN